MSDDRISDEVRAATSEVDVTAQSRALEMRALVGQMTGAPDAVSRMDDASLRVLSSALVERMMFARQAGITFNGQRDVYEILGYNRILTYREYRARYMRGGLAKRVVDAYPSAIWRAGAELYEDEDPQTDTDFEQAWRSLDARLSVWSRFQRVHILSSLSTYAVLLIGAPGELNTPLPRGNSPDSVLYLQPFSGGGGPQGGDQQDNRSRAMNADCSIATFDTDSKSPRFGLPETYQLKRTTISAPVFDRQVHWSRMIHVADGLLGDEVYGTPALEAVWNLLDDLDKVTGGGAEAFWLRANAGLHLNIDKTMGAPSSVPGRASVAGMDAAARQQLHDQAEELKHQLQRVMVTRGVEATQLSSNVADFNGPADSIITQIAGTKGIPKRILVGSEMGQLASGQDKDNWNTQVQDRRTSWAFPGLVKPLVDRLCEYGYLPKPKTYAVEWPVIEDLTEDEKASLALRFALANRTQGSVLFTPDWIREKTYGLAPLTADEMAAMPAANVPTDQIAGTLAQLEAAIQANDLETLGRLVGVR